MIVAAHQINFAPWIGYFVKIQYVDQFILAKNVQFTKHGFSNRVKIKTVSCDQWLTVPVITKGKGLQQIQNVKIDNSQNWQKKHWKTLLVNYKNAPYFEKYSDTLHDIYFKNWVYLADFNLQLIKFICNELNISTKLRLTSDMNIKESDNATQHIINMITFVGGKTYISGQSGKNYLKEDTFEKHNIELQYFNFEHPHYHQQFAHFIPNLSIFDLLLNEGPNAEKIFKNIKIVLEKNRNQNAEIQS